MTDPTPAPFDPAAVAKAARGDEPTGPASKTGDLSGVERRRIMAYMTGAHEPPRPHYPLFPEAADRPEFAGIASAVAAFEAATRRREEAQDAYEDAEGAYGLDVGAWERAQRDIAAKVAAGGKMPSKLDPRPAPATYEAKAELLARVAGEAFKAEAAAAERVNAAYREAGLTVATYAAETQRAIAPGVRDKLADALAAVEELTEAHEQAYAARVCAEADRMAQAEGMEPKRAYSRQHRERAGAYVAQSFYTREAANMGDVRDAMNTLRRYVEALTAEDLSAPWPDGADPARKVLAAAQDAARQIDALVWRREERAMGDRAANMEPQWAVGYR